MEFETVFLASKRLIVHLNRHEKCADLKLFKKYTKKYLEIRY